MFADTLINHEAGILVSSLAFMGLRTCLRLQQSCSAVASAVTLQLPNARRLLPKKCKVSCISRCDVDLLWAALSDEDWSLHRESDGRSLLHVAAELKCAEVLAYLTSLPAAPALVNKRNSFGKAAIHIAAANGFGIEHILKLPGIDIEIRDNYQSTAIILAAREQQYAVVEALLAKKADVNAFALYSGPRIATALASAVSLNDEALVRLLLTSPDLVASQPLLLGVPRAPTARDFAKTERIRQLLVDRASMEGTANCTADPDACASIGIGLPSSVGEDTYLHHMLGDPVPSYSLVFPDDDIEAYSSHVGTPSHPPPALIEVQLRHDVGDITGYLQLLRRLGNCMSGFCQFGLHST